MRLIHTADWHLGRKLKGCDRTPEIAHALDRLLADAIALSVDAVLVAGDLYDMPNPTAEAERVAYRFFHDLSQAGIPAVVIAGNHDSGSRLEGVASLLEIANVHALGRVRTAGDGGVVAVDTKSGKLRVGALPFASERRLLSADDLWLKDDTEQRQTYRETMAYLMGNLAGGFGDDTVNVLMAHVALDGATLSHSEAPFYTTGAYCLSEDTLPGAAQYVALGHIHKWQRVNAAAPAYYSGSVIQVDFGEAQEEKGYNLITVEPGRPATVEFRTLPCQKPLKVVRCEGKALEQALDGHRDHPGWLKVIVELESPELGLADRVRKVCPQALVIEPRYPEKRATDGSQGPVVEKLSPTEAYKQYYQDRFERTPGDGVLRAFAELYEELSHASA